ncbi:conserved hypothetical protein [Ancylobacter novellus DSM 506]|uniref:Uncharacterized protein n=1 Tax=Ancylobacter novellus (strain ATCC 8093 / DSM 506 / JCM 20403 / CCM 1077 / IAM 12100 / NBRC 12443 / NCIMB 10456) TaxID=639283 RepID=D7A2P9_ANCN5|nr:hypothetical protein [Ancylobacter novellus]ADH91579.1 conserved hypothetical protein [Ancylobacter novellus DSM 506]
MTEKLEALRARLVLAQRELIKAAAEAGTVPSDNALRKIADLEVTIGAVETMIDEERTR